MMEKLHFSINIKAGALERHHICDWTSIFTEALTSFAKGEN